MSLATTPNKWTPSTDETLQAHLRIPESLEQQLLGYRRRVWSVKLTEAISKFVVVSLLVCLAAYGLDRTMETPGWLRGGLLLLVLLAAYWIPHTFYRWVWRRRSLEQLARLLSRRIPAVGDSLLGVIELAHNQQEQSRSPALCQAAMRQVAADAERRDLMVAVPHTRYRSWAVAAGVVALVAAGIALAYPAAAANTLRRLVLPWGSTPRFTFTRVAELPSPWYVPHGEPVSYHLALADDSLWEPSSGTIRVGTQPASEVPLDEGGYTLTLPPQIATQTVDVRIGDTIQQVRLEPTLRPEIASVSARVELPDYLQLPTPRTVDARGGQVSVVRGSRVRFTAEANRELVSATVDGGSVDIEAERFSTPVVEADAVQRIRLDWRDRYGLAGRTPLELQLAAVEDQSPTLICDGLPRQAVVLASELLKFEVRVGDDFGVRRVGIAWRGVPDAVLGEPAAGERVLAAGGPDRESLELVGTFSASSYGIEPQPLELMVWAEDYREEGARVFSSPYTLYVLTPDEHAIWMTEQLSKWHRQALEVRDRELQLYETNKELRDLDPAARGTAETQQRIEQQAQAERSNGRRLNQLSGMGAQLVQQASRNPEIGVGHLEQWAETLQVLQDISANRMPSVAELLDEAAQNPAALAGPTKPSGPQAGQDRGQPQAGGSQADPDAKASKNQAPSLVDRESSMNAAGEPQEPGPPKKPNDPALRLPVTTLTGPGKKPAGAKPPANSADKPLERAVEEQEALLAEFEKLADELNDVLGNLEGSTLVKRLKAASRKQYMIAGRIGEQIEPSFGRRAARLDEAVTESLQEMERVEEESVQEISYIMDDMAAYFERRRFARFQTVLEQMKEEDVIGGMRQLSGEIAERQGLSVAEAEYWSDALDRWAEDLVDPAGSGQCPGGKSPESLPPSIVLEVLQILEGEINLREETRVAEQAREAVALEQHMEEGLRLSDKQVQLEERVLDVIRRIGELPEAQKHFAQELQLLGQVDVVMGEATRLLAEPNTGAPAIAAETEAIELLLQSKRINPNSGGGGGSTPGGGGSGEGTDSALALVGSGVNQKEVREQRDVGQTTGETGTVLPEEFRSGLDEYFNQIESGGAQP